MGRPRTRFSALASAAIAFATVACVGEEARSDEMVVLPAGNYTPFLRLTAAKPGAPTPANVVAIPAFELDVEPVTNAEFVDFVRAHPSWRRSNVKRVFADAKYLRRWSGDLALVDDRAAEEPVTNVSWFAAQAYCKARGERLPTTEQWEYALADDGRAREEVRSRSLDWFAQPNSARLPTISTGKPNGFGLRDLVGLVWEWTLDFDAYSVAAESRDPNGKDSALVCGGAAAGATDATDYPGFMRFSLRASLKADYTSDNLGFRCARGAP